MREKTIHPPRPAPAPALAVLSRARLARSLLGALSALGLLAAALPALAWEGHDWNAWRRVATWRRPEGLRTAQSGRKDLAPFSEDEAGNPKRTCCIRAWQLRRAEIERAIEAVLGAPSGLERRPVEARVLGEEALGDHIRRRVEIRAEPDDWIPAYLLVPKDLAAGEKAPAMLCLHQTVAQGKDEPCGIRGDPELAFARELVRRRFVCLVPDSIGFGERIPPGAQPYHESIAFYRRHPGWSFLGKMVWDSSRAVDYLEALPFVDRWKIGAIGHSHGAYGALFAAVFEPRISLAVASCGFTTFRSDPAPDRWSHATALLPQLGEYLPDVASIPFDWHHVCALIAPRPLFVWYATGDPIFPHTENLDALFEEVKTIYHLYGDEGALAWRWDGGGHRFPAAVREAAYRWIEERWAIRPGAAAERGREAEPRGPAGPPVPPGPSPEKAASSFYPPDAVARARRNVREHAWAAAARDAIVAAAEPWRRMADGELWRLVFGNTIRRSWMVWSNGHCPSCREPVPMYAWIADALERPWKMRCPRCGELFPKNDFGRFYASGLDGRGIFDPARADRSLLFNAEHPDLADPLRGFGVDDGEGYVEGEKRWRFVGAYLIYGQWKQAILGGIRNLSAAYLLTGDPTYARKAGILLDRVADVYPSFDFGREGVLYEGPARSGYVSTWHDACVEVREIALAYDAVFDGIARDAELVAFLAERAARSGLENPKTSFAWIQRNIEDRILRDTLANRPKIESNYPSTDVTLAVLQTVLEWPDCRAEVEAILDSILARATAADGLSGEKGLTGYSAIAPRNVAEILGLFARADPAWIGRAVAREPRLHAMYRFHLDAQCLGEYYPRTGDAGSFAAKDASYPALPLSRSPRIEPSPWRFLWDLYEATGDADFVRLLYRENGSSVEGLPYDLFEPDPGEFQRRVAALVAERGADISIGSVLKRDWGLAILRSGRGRDARALWLDFDSGGAHGHADAMNLGLFAKGLDLLPDLGYPPVQHGGWGAPRALWYGRTAAHNTVAVDGRDSRPGLGKVALWFDGGIFRAVRASGPALLGVERYERTAALVDVSDEESYVADIFRVAGGSEHTKSIHSHFGRLAIEGLSLEPGGAERAGGLLRNFRKCARPAPPGWSADWTIEDRLGILGEPRDVHLRSWELTPDAEVETAEGWVAVGLFGDTAEAWIPRVLVTRRAAAAPLSSAFVAVMHPYEGRPSVASARRLAAEDREGRALPAADVALEVRLADGRRDVLVAADAEGRAAGPADAAAGDRSVAAVPIVVVPEFGLRLEGELGLVRFRASGEPERAVLCRGRSLAVGGAVLRPRDGERSIEAEFPSGERKEGAGAGPAAAWRFGVSKAKITPEEPLWMAGFAARTRPAEGALDDLWVQALALEAPDGGLGVFVAADLLGLPKGLYETIVARARTLFGLERARILIACSHTHSGPVLRDALPDIYPFEDHPEQPALIEARSRLVEEAIVRAIGEALSSRRAGTLAAGEGSATFAVNRRTNRESDLPEILRRGEKPRGPSDHAVPVLALRSEGGELRAVVFGYAAHPSALSGYQWSADYVGFARRALEAAHPDAVAMFFQGCGSDQSAAPRGTLDQCRGMGETLAAAVEAVLAKPMRPVAPRFRAAMDLIPLDFGETPSRADLETAREAGGYRARWARRLLRELDGGAAFPRGYPEYPVQVWRLGDQLWIALGGEVSVEYSLLFKSLYGPETWVAGYANEVMAYIPSRRIWEEGGYQAGAFDVYGLPATRWAGDVEERIAAAVARRIRGRTLCTPRRRRGGFRRAFSGTVHRVPGKGRAGRSRAFRTLPSKPESRPQSLG